MSSTAESYLGYYPEAELVIGIVCPLGTNYQPVLETLKNYLDQFEYTSNEIKLSDRFDDLLQKLGVELPESGRSAAASMLDKIRAGNEIRRRTADDVMALIAASAVAEEREGLEDDEAQPSPRSAHIIISIKHPREVECLRRVYGAGFFLLGISTSRKEREEYLKERGVDPEQIDGLIEIDAKEEFGHGQHTRDTFYLSDVFVSLRHYKKQIPRFLDLIFGCPYLTPTTEEQAMYMAYAASLRSGDLSRQVGAALVDSSGDLLSIGCNEVPRFGGGLYGPEKASQRDIELGEDSNEAEKLEMAAKIMALVQPGWTAEERKNRAREVLKPTGFFDITEFGRSVHAEMEALLACTRTGRSTRGATLYATTFPCHNCTRHIIDAGVHRVVYIEPYAKSKAFSLHKDAITVDEEATDKIPFVPFIGIGPRRYLDLFSLSLGTGYPLERKQAGRTVPWERKSAAPRLQMQPSSYLSREMLAYKRLKELLLQDGIE